MPSWILKAIVQKSISYLPYKSKINFIFQKYVTKGVFLSDEYFFDRLDHAKSHLDAYKKNNSSKIPENSLELGTGWYPVVPVAFFLSGVNKIHSVDLSFLTSKDRIYTTLTRFIDAFNKGDLFKYISISEKRYSELNSIYNNYNSYSLNEILNLLHLDYHVTDARSLNFPDNHIDLVNSNNTFEHIYPEILSPILAELWRVTRKNQGGVMSHFIDMSDHFAHFDKNISIYNFLKYSEKQWRRIDNDIQPQNRLRFDDYKEMYQNLQIPITEESFRPGNIQSLKTVKLQSPFANKSDEINAISHCHLISL